MSRNLEANDSNANKNNESHDFTNDSLSQSFSREDQQAVFKRNSQSDKNVGSLDLDTTDSGNGRGARKIDFPHNWYESSKSNLYGLPSESVITGGVEQTIRQGWGKLNK